MAASYQAAIVSQLVGKTLACAQAEGLRRVAVAGGVAANSGLRRAFAEACAAHDITLYLPPLALCTDNAAMIGLAAGFLPAPAVARVPGARRLRLRACRRPDGRRTLRPVAAHPAGRFDSESS